MKEAQCRVCGKIVYRMGSHTKAIHNLTSK